MLLFDYLLVGQSGPWCEYDIIFRKKTSAYVQFRLCFEDDSFWSATVLVEYSTSFVSVLYCILDGVPHFCNGFMEFLSFALSAPHRIFTAYALWTNGTVKAVFKEITFVLRSFRANLHVPKTEMHSILTVRQSLRINPTSQRLVGLATFKEESGMGYSRP